VQQLRASKMIDVLALGAATALCTSTHCNSLQHRAQQLRACIEIGRFLPPALESHCNTLQHTATHCNTCNICNTLQHSTTHCKSLQLTATQGATIRCMHRSGPCLTPATTITAQHIATHCNTLQHTATHCNTLQHIATHCNTGRNNYVHASKWPCTRARHQSRGASPCFCNNTPGNISVAGLCCRALLQVFVAGLCCILVLHSRTRDQSRWKKNCSQTFLFQNPKTIESVCCFGQKKCSDRLYCGLLWSIVFFLFFGF